MARAWGGIACGSFVDVNSLCGCLHEKNYNKVMNIVPSGCGDANGATGAC